MPRLVELLIVILLLPVVLPLLALVALIVRIGLGGPVLFRQPRVGLNGRIFTLNKFRTMTDRRNSAGELLPDAERLTRLGKFLRSTSLDELPSFLNVLQGTVSLVGPRPLLIEYLPLYSARQARRHDVKPGITGWAQVMGRNSLSWDEKFDYDVWYVENRSIWLDIKILFLTAYTVLKRDGVSANDHVTMPKFAGSDDRNQGSSY